MSKASTENKYKDSIHLPVTDFPMKAGLPTKEPKILEKWQKLEVYKLLQQQRVGKPSYVLHDGPPYANGNIHIGHAMQKILKDIVIKSKNLQGLRVPYVPGWDCHGLPIEIQVEKKHGKAGVKIDKAMFRQKCREYAKKQVEGQKVDFMRLGIQGDWEQPYLTMDYKTEADTVRALAKIVDSGHLYHGLMPVYWCPACASALAEAEVEYQDKISPSIDVKFPVKEIPKFAEAIGVEACVLDAPSLVIWTTTPWTLPANEAVSVHPEYMYVLVSVAGQQLVLAKELVESALQRYSLAQDANIIAEFSGKQLEYLKLQHPFYDKESLVILGEHVTIDSGTGCVHTAPAHGPEDFAVAKQYNLPINNPVGSNGTFLESIEIFAGEFVFKANPHVVEVLSESGHLLHHEEYEHSYPHCWRHKTPMIYRATSQWFIGMQKKSGEHALRHQALNAIKAVNWLPDWGQARIETMVENRPDWCISRQRNWGVPIPIFLHKETGEIHPQTSELMEKVALLIEKTGVQAWYDLEVKALLGNEAEQYEKVVDILDVWFDSGVTHQSVVKAREQLTFPADLYLEGSDQHRGWFQSSLLTSVAMTSSSDSTGVAPYKTVLTHGFVVDKDGRKMSKSQGNVIAPQSVIQSLGADILRLWVASTDYRTEVSLSDEILKRTSDSYRRIRNTCRYLLGNLHGFKHDDALPYDSLLSLDQWAVRQVAQMQQEIEKDFEAFNFHLVYQRLHQFCVVDMGSFYLDILKDRLYTCQSSSIARLSAQTAMNHILQSLVRCMMPILSFTAEEIWQHMTHIDSRKEEEQSVLLTTRYAELDGIPQDGQSDDYWKTIVDVRNEVSKSIEALRVKGDIGASLDAKVTLYAEKDLYNHLTQLKDELRFVLITSSSEVYPMQQLSEGLRGELTDCEITGLNIHVTALDDKKCIRCWHRRPEIGENNAHPELCQRCIDNIEGEGEQRLFA